MPTISVKDYLKAVAAAPKGSKYRNKPSGGHASRKEHARALQLQQMQAAGLISSLRQQVRFEIIPAGFVGGRRVLAPCHYVADFVYVDSNGNTVVEDVKGYRTKEYLIKRKLMLHVHGILITET